MKKLQAGIRPWLAACGLLLAVLLTACGPAPTPVPTASPAETQEPIQPPGTVTASAEVVPAQHAHLAFVISGTVKEVAVSEGDPVALGQKLVELSAPELEFGLLQAEDATRAAEFEYQYWIPARLDRPPERRLLAEQEFIATQRTLDTARALLTQATLNAPFDGVVVDVSIVPGELVQPGQVVVTLASLDKLQIETTDLSERDLPQIQVGQPAEVFVEALNQDFPGKVIAISPIADKLGGDVIYKVTVALDSPAEGMLWGMTAEVHIQTE